MPAGLALAGRLSVRLPRSAQTRARGGGRQATRAACRTATASIYFYSLLILYHALFLTIHLGGASCTPSRGTPDCASAAATCATPVDVLLPATRCRVSSLGGAERRLDREVAFLSTGQSEAPRRVHRDEGVQAPAARRLNGSTPRETTSSFRAIKTHRTLIRRGHHASSRCGMLSVYP